MTVTVSWDRRNPGAFGRRLRALASVSRRAIDNVVMPLTRPHRAALSTLAHMPLYCAGVAGVDFAVFHVGHGWGWLAVGLSLIITERVIADDQ